MKNVGSYVIAMIEYTEGCLLSDRFHIVLYMSLVDDQRLHAIVRLLFVFSHAQRIWATMSPHPRACQRLIYTSSGGHPQMRHVGGGHPPQEGR